MIDKATIASKMYGVVGLRQPYNAVYAIIDAANLTSRSGYYANDNPFAKVEFLIDCMDYPDATNLQINEVIKNMQISAITDVCNMVFDEPDFIDRQFVFNNTINKATLETTYNGFCGYELKQLSEKNVAFEITRIALAFSGTGSITIALFNSAITAPLQTKTVSITTDYQVVDLNWCVNGATLEYQGKYYIGLIRQAGVVPIPYKRDYEDSSVVSGIRFLDVQSVWATGTSLTNMKLGDLTQLQYVSESHGLNPEINVFYDFTSLAIRNERLFAKAIDLAFQIKIINSYLVSSRSNRNERIGVELIQKAVAEVDGVGQAPGVINKIGLRAGLTSEINFLKQQVQKLKDNYNGSRNALKVMTNG